MPDLPLYSFLFSLCTTCCVNNSVTVKLKVLDNLEECQTSFTPHDRCFPGGFPVMSWLCLVCNLSLTRLSVVLFCCQAMQEFAHLCQEKDAKVVLSILPLWPKVYAKLSIVSRSHWITLCWYNFNVHLTCGSRYCVLKDTPCCWGNNVKKCCRVISFLHAI